MNRILIILILIVSTFSNACLTSNIERTDTSQSAINTFDIIIPMAGNSWMLDNGTYSTDDIIAPDGIRNWNTPNRIVRTFFYLEKTGTITMGISAKVNTGVSKIKITFGSKSKVVTIDRNGVYDIVIGEFKIERAGYYYLELEGLEKEGTVYADINDLLLGGVQADEVKYAKDDFYFARRGPSVHLNFEVPAEVDQVKWFYSELTIPQNQDVIGSYFMANGFGEGYFGIQVNSTTERRILFSIWSPYQTDNPNEIPEDYKIQLLKKGNDVYTGEFGNEGSGGQSFKVFNWKTNISYGFLVGAQPTPNGATDYTAYFFDPEINQWHLIAKFRRPKTRTYLKHLYSFLENFIPEQGVIARKGYFENQWVHDGADWHELTTATFTADNTARKGYRLDYSGGSENEKFYLKNCGFTNDQVLIDSRFERTSLGRSPNIDFSRLE